MTQKNKNILLFAGLLVLFVIAYRYSFSKTFAVRSEVRILETEKEIKQSTPAQLITLANKEKELDKILVKNNVEGSSVQNNILKILNDLSEVHKFKIIAFEEPHVFNDEATQKNATTYNFTIEGEYKSIITVIYKLEQQYSFGNVINVNFEKKKNYKTRKEYLQCNILLQRLN